MNEKCHGCGIYPLGVTHVCPPPEMNQVPVGVQISFGPATVTVVTQPESHCRTRAADLAPPRRGGAVMPETPSPHADTASTRCLRYGAVSSNRPPTSQNGSVAQNTRAHIAPESPTRDAAVSPTPNDPEEEHLVA